MRAWLEGGGFFIAGFIGSLVIGWVIFPMVLYSKQPQPMNFNHALHLNPEKVDGIEGETEAERCLHCHGFYDDGTFKGIPNSPRARSAMITLNHLWETPLKRRPLWMDM